MTGTKPTMSEQAIRTKKTQASAVQEAGADIEEQLSQELEKMCTPNGYKRPKWCGQNGVLWLDNSTKDNASVHVKLPIACGTDQQSQCVFRFNGDVFLHVFISSISDPVPKVDPGTIVIKESQTGGLGVFALRNIKRGELLLAERPLVVCPMGFAADTRGWWAKILTLILNGSQAELSERFKRIQAYEREMEMQKMFSKMTPENQRAYLSLANSHKEDGTGPVSGILRTNGFEIGLPASEKSDMTRYIAIGKVASRLNHSCCPNAVIGFSNKSFSIQSYAGKDIKAGEEVFCSYFCLRQSAREREEKLSPYGFKCKCRACQFATPSSDTFRKVSEEKVVKFRDTFKSNTDPSRWANLLSVGLQLEKQMREEGLDLMEGPYYILRSTIAELYRLLQVGSGHT